jgi:dephospho-CoA kinase
VLRVGLTGGIACGKSHVLRRLLARGCHTLDLDAVARQVTAPGAPALAEIRAAFGPSALDAAGALDRASLGARVFADAAARERLNRIVHPRVRAAEAEWAAGFASRADAVLVTDGALLVESGVHLRFDRLVVVHCAPALQLARLRARDGLDERAARARIEAQLGSAEKRAFAHFEVDTSGSPAETDGAADALAGALSELARSPGAPPSLRREALERLVGGLVRGPDQGPRGLSPRGLLEDAAACGGLEMEHLARRLVPAASGPWYRAALEHVPALPAARLAVAVAAWAAARRPGDRDFAAWVAASVARLTHAHPRERADACLAALEALARAEAPGEPPRPPVPDPRLVALATRFGGGAPSGRIDAPTAQALEGIGAAAFGGAASGWRALLGAPPA